MTNTTPTNIKKTTTFRVEMNDKPGELAHMLNSFHQANVNLIGNWTWAENDHKAYSVFVAANPEATETFLKTTDWKYTTETAYIYEGSDDSGAFYNFLTKSAEAGVDYHAANAIATSGKFCTVLWPKEGHYETFNKVYGCTS